MSEPIKNPNVTILQPPRIISTEQQLVNANYNTMKSSLMMLEEQVSIQKFNTYASIVIKQFTVEQDEITEPRLREMIKQLCALAEFCFTDFKCGQQKKMNVKQQIQCVLNNDKSSAPLKIADVLVDYMVEDVIKDNTHNQLIAIAKNVLKIATKATGFLAGCMK